MLGRSGYMPTNAGCPERRAGISQAAIRCNISKALSVCRLKAILLTLILPTRERKIERAPAQNTKTFLCRVEQMTLCETSTFTFRPLSQRLPQNRQNRGIFRKSQFLLNRDQRFQIQYAYRYTGLDFQGPRVTVEIFPSPRFSDYPQHVQRPEFRQQKLMARTCQMRFTRAQLPLRLGTIYPVKLPQRGQ